MKHNQEISIEEHCFVVHDQFGNTTVKNDMQHLDDEKYGYTKVFFRKDGREKSMDNLYVDNQFQIQISDFDDIGMKGSKIILKRISKLYSKKYWPSLFPADNQMKTIANQGQIYPPFIYQMHNFSSFIFKKLFITQTISQNGKYEILVNKDGRFQIETIDDLVPVYENNQQSIWDLDTTNPWQLLIAKVWAKHLGGYKNVTKSKCFQFLQYFTESNWKYYNLSIEGKNFLQFYHDKMGKQGKILFKTKQAKQVELSGLVSGIIGYELIDIVVQQTEPKTYIVILKSVLSHSWTGKYSIFDKGFKEQFQKINKPFQMMKNLMLGQKDFLNLFSSAYITTRQNFTYFSNYYRYKLEPNYKHAKYFTFNIQKQGHFVFSIRQPRSNIVKLISNKSRIQFKQQHVHQLNDVEQRYLSLKYMLGRCVQNEEQVINNKDALGMLTSQIKESTLKFKGKFGDLKYDCYEVDYKKGYNRGDAHFIKIIPGKYILRIKSETVNKQSNFTVHFSCHEPTQITEATLNKEQSIIFLQHNLASISDFVPHKSFSDHKNEVLSLGNIFNKIGYGFICLKVNKKSPYSVVIELDPIKVRQDGYTIKGEHKDRTDNLRIQIINGQFAIVILKRIKDGRDEDKYVWPVSSFKTSTITK